MNIVVKFDAQAIFLNSTIEAQNDDEVSSLGNLSGSRSPVNSKPNLNSFTDKSEPGIFNLRYKHIL